MAGHTRRRAPPCRHTRGRCASAAENPQALDFRPEPTSWAAGTAVPPPFGPTLLKAPACIVSRHVAPVHKNWVGWRGRITIVTVIHSHICGRQARRSGLDSLKRRAPPGRRWRGNFFASEAMVMRTCAHGVFGDGDAVSPEQTANCQFFEIVDTPV